MISCNVKVGTICDNLHTWAACCNAAVAHHEPLALSTPCDRPKDVYVQPGVVHANITCMHMTGLQHPMHWLVSALACCTCVFVPDIVKLS